MTARKQRGNPLPTRDEIATMCIEEFEHRISTLKKADFGFTASEKRNIGIYRRMIRNREYARTTRKKKRDLLEFLEGRVCELESECYALRSEIVRMHHEHAKAIDLPSMPSPWEAQPLFNHYNTEIDSNIVW